MVPQLRAERCIFVCSCEGLTGYGYGTQAQDTGGRQGNELKASFNKEHKMHA